MKCDVSKKNQLQNQKGFSLTELMVGVGIAGLVAIGAGVAQVQTTLIQSNTQRFQSLYNDFQLVRLALNSEQGCLASVGGGTITSSGNTVPLTRINDRNGQALVSTTGAGAARAIGGAGSQVDSIQLIVGAMTQESTAANPYRAFDANVRIRYTMPSFSMSGVSGAPTQQERNFSVKVGTDPTTNRIVTCYSNQTASTVSQTINALPSCSAGQILRGIAATGQALCDTAVCN